MRVPLEVAIMGKISTGGTCYVEIVSNSWVNIGSSDTLPTATYL